MNENRNEKCIVRRNVQTQITLLLVDSNKYNCKDNINEDQ